MIKSITMKNCATYNDEGVKFDNCAKVNFIYGANGSGKSTVSNYLSNIYDLAFNDCSVEFDSDLPSDILVYNRHFREKHLGGGDIPGIFTLGSSTKEDIEKINKLKTDRENKKSELTKARTTLEGKRAEREGKKDKFKEAIWKHI